MRIFINENTVKDSYENKKIIDFDLIKKRDKFIVKPRYYIFIFAIYLIAIILAFVYEKTYPFFMWIFLSLSMMMSDLILDKNLMKNSIVAYTDNSKRNIFLNEKIAKNQANVLFMKSLINSIVFILLVSSIIINPFSMLTFFIYIIAISFSMIYAFYKYKKLRNDPILSRVNTSNISSNVEYYNAWGYNNPDDKRLLVPRLNGLGQDLNMGRALGKILYFVSISILFFLVLVINKTFNSPTQYTYVLENNRIEISSNQFYDDTIRVEDIKSLKFLDKLPEGRLIRIGGNSLEKTNTGNYMIQNYGKVRLYIYNSTKNVVEIKTSDKNFLINENSNVKTQKLYKRLKNYIK